MDLRKTRQAVSFTNTVRLSLAIAVALRRACMTSTVHEPDYTLKRNSFSVKLANPWKADSDQKSYRLIRLMNGMKVLLVDTSATVRNEISKWNKSVAACCLLVDVGSFSDPPDIQGLAHFVEHMVTAGSKKFPGENDYRSYVTEGSGVSNAATYEEHTLYYFNVKENHLEGALDRLSSFFISPLMPIEAMIRERYAVDAEFHQKLHSCTDQILLSLGNEDHPSGKFLVGNLTTLRDNIFNADLYNKVHAFRDWHYSAHRMKVCIQAAKPLDELQVLAEKYFSDVPCNYKMPEDFTKFDSENAFSRDFGSKVYYVTDYSNKLDLTWVIPQLLNKYKCKPHVYVLHVLRQKGKGSLYALLSKNLVALDVDADLVEDNSMYALLGLTITLTQKGLDNIPEILKTVAAYLRMMQQAKVSEKLFKELQRMEWMKFQYREEKSARENVQDLVINMKNYDTEQIIGGETIIYKYDETEIAYLIFLLVSKNYNIIVTSMQPIPGIHYIHRERWYGFNYGCIDIPSLWARGRDSIKTIETFHLPMRNRFIPGNFEIVKQARTSRHLVKLLDTPKVQLFFQADRKFHLPTASATFYLKSDKPRASIKSRATLELMMYAIYYGTLGKLDSARTAGYDIEITAEELGLVFEVTGFSDKIYLVIEILGEFLGEFPDNVDEEFFNEIKSKSLMDAHRYLNVKTLTEELRKDYLQETFYANYDVYTTLTKLKFKDFLRLSEEYLENLKMIALIQGNISKENAVQITETFEEDLQYEPLARKIIVPEVMVVPIGESLLRLRYIHPGVNTCVTNYYQIGPSNPELEDAVHNLVSAMKSPLYDALRTQEQLGYGVEVKLVDDHGMLGYSITVQSQENKHKATDIDEKIEDFRRSFLKFYDVDDEPDTSLVQDNLPRSWDDLIVEECDRVKRARGIDAVLQDTVEVDYVKFLVSQTRKLSVQVIGECDNPTEMVLRSKEREFGRKLKRFKNILKRASSVDECDERRVSM